MIVRKQQQLYLERAFELKVLLLASYLANTKNDAPKESVVAWWNSRKNTKIQSNTLHNCCPGESSSKGCLEKHLEQAKSACTLFALILEQQIVFGLGVREPYVTDDKTNSWKQRWIEPSLAFTADRWYCKTKRNVKFNAMALMIETPYMFQDVFRVWRDCFAYITASLNSFTVPVVDLRRPSVTSYVFTSLQ